MAGASEIQHDAGDVGDEPVRVLVCGGRDYSDDNFLTNTLDAIHGDTPITMLIHGNAPGADTLAGKWSIGRCIPTLAVPANWVALGKAAGPTRNAAMLQFKPHLVVAFPGGVGTDDMISKARGAAIPVYKL